MPKKKKYRKKSGSGITRDAVGMFGYAIAEGFIDNIMKNFNIGLPTNVLEAGLGYFLKKRGGMLGSVGKVMFYVNGVQIIKDVIGGGFNLGNIFTTQATQTQAVYQ